MLAVAGCFPDPPGANDTETALDTSGGDTSVLADTFVDDSAAADTDTAAPDTSACPNGCGSLDGPCQVGVCTAGGCVAEPQTGGCDDGLACTSGDHCEAGVCVGVPIVCSAKDSCHVAGVCDAGTGRCSDPRKPDTAACDDGDVCTEGEACAAGVCQGGSIPNDSGDWVLKVPEVGNQALWVDEAGDIWWFVSVAQPETDFGETVGGGTAKLVLPEGATHGVGVLHFTSAGAIADATLLAHSTAPMRIPARALNPVRVERVGGAPLLMVVMTFEETLSLGQGARSALLEPRLGGPVGYVAAYFRSNAALEARVAFGSEGMSAEDNLQYGPIGVAWGPGGALALALPILADRLAFVEGVEFRGPPTSTTSQLVVRYPGFAIGSLWQRFLVGTSPVAPFVPYCNLAFDSDGNLWIIATYAGRAAWRRVEGERDLDSVPDVGDNFGMLKARVTTDARLTATTTFYSAGTLPLVTWIAGADEGGGGAVVAWGRGTLTQVDMDGNSLALVDLGLPTQVFQAVVQFAEDGSTLAVDPGGARMGFSALGFSAGGPWARVDASEADPAWSGPSLRGVGPWVVGLARGGGGGRGWALPILGSGAAELKALAVSSDGAIIPSIFARAGGLVVNTSTQGALAEGEAGIALLNSERGATCGQR